LIAKRKRNKYRPVAQREQLEKLLIAWRAKAHASDPLRAVRRPSLILNDNDIKTLTMALSTMLKSPHNVVTLLKQSEEWAMLWGTSVFSVISSYTYVKPVRAPTNEDSSDDEPLMKKINVIIREEGN